MGMAWTGWIAFAAVCVALAGCGYGYRMVVVQPRYSVAARPEGSYFCYDCHGYRYFDPYYDYCAGRGFRYAWAEHPATIALYRERYVRIKEEHPDYGRYQYRSGYRSESSYRDPRDYEPGREGMKQGSGPHAQEKSHAKGVKEPGTTKERKGEKRKGPRDDGSRLTLPGGVS